MTTCIDILDPRFKDFHFQESLIISLSQNAQIRSVDLVIDYAHADLKYYYANGPSPPPESPKRVFIHVCMQEVTSLNLMDGKESRSFSELSTYRGALCLYDLKLSKVDRSLKFHFPVTHACWKAEVTCGSAWYETRVCTCSGNKESGWIYRDIETREVVDFYRPFAIAQGDGWNEGRS